MDEAFFEVDCTSARLLLQVFCRPPPRAPFLPPRAPRRPSSTAPHLLQPVRSGSDMAYHCQKPRAAPARKCVVSHRRPPAAAGDGDVRKHKIRLFEPPRIGATRTRPLATPRHERCGSGAFMVRDDSWRPNGRHEAPHHDDRARLRRMRSKAPVFLMVARQSNGLASRTLMVRSKLLPGRVTPCVSTMKARLSHQATAAVPSIGVAAIIGSPSFPWVASGPRWRWWPHKIPNRLFRSASSTSSLSSRSASRPLPRTLPR